MSMRIPRPYQIEGIQRFLDRPLPMRFFFAWEMGAGKTFASLLAMQKAGVKTLLIICPAIVRDTWGREVEVVFSRDCGIIRYGRKRKLSIVKDEERQKSYEAPIQIVSYDLLGECSGGPWDGIIVDECHSLRDPQSIQSKRVKALLRSNVGCHAIGLSGTFIPGQAKQAWNPIDTFIPGALGHYGSFQRSYCKREENVYATSGFNFFGLREDKRDELQSKLAPFIHRVTQSEFAKYLPPLNVEPLHCSDSRLDRVKFAVDWFESVRHEQPHVGIYTHHRALAQQIYDNLLPKTGYATLIMGDSNVSYRDQWLRQCQDQEHSLVIGTTHALGQGVSLSFQKCALVVEWTTAPDQVLQFIGRFSRQDSLTQAPTSLQFLVGPNDVGRSDKLLSRVSDINHLIRAGRAETKTAAAFEAKGMEDDEFEAAMARLIRGTEKRSLLWGDENDEDGDESDD